MSYISEPFKITSSEDRISRDIWYRNITLPDKIAEIVRTYKYKEKKFYTPREIDYLLSLEAPVSDYPYNREYRKTKRGNGIRIP